MKELLSSIRDRSLKTLKELARRPGGPEILKLLEKAESGKEPPVLDIPEGNGGSDDPYGEWVEIRRDGQESALKEIFEDGCERVDLLYKDGEKRFRTVPIWYWEHFPPPFSLGDKDEIIKVRRRERGGKRALSIFLKGPFITHLGSLEFLLPPRTIWARGNRTKEGEDGDVFVYPPMTIPPEREIELIGKSMEALKGEECGIHTMLWVGSEGWHRYEIIPLGCGLTAEAIVMGVIAGMDIIKVHWMARAGLLSEGHIKRISDPFSGGDPYGVFAGTIPQKGDGHLVGGRSLEQVLNLLIHSTLPKRDGGLIDYMNRLTCDLKDDEIVFSEIDRGILDPLFIQKLYKLSKMRKHLSNMKLDPAFPDTSSIMRFSSAKRWGFTDEEISRLCGLDIGELRDIMHRFLKEPSLAPVWNDVVGHKPYIIVWPEAEGHCEPGGCVEIESEGAAAVLPRIVGNGDGPSILLTDKPGSPYFLEWGGGVVFAPPKGEIAHAIISGSNVSSVLLDIRGKTNS